MNTNIRNIFILTLKETPHRKWGSIGALESRRFPMKYVHPVHGIDGLKYPDHESLIDDAVADGFEFFGTNEDFKGIPIGMAAGTWSACRVLRHVIETNTTSIVLEDDWIFRTDYENILEMLDKCHPETQIAVLLCKRFDGSDYELELYNDAWIKGVPASAGAANVYTPAGAKIALDLFYEHKGKTVERIIHGIEYPTALTVNTDIVFHPLLMGYSRANPRNSRVAYVESYERWENGYEALSRDA